MRRALPVLAVVLGLSVASATQVGHDEGRHAVEGPSTVGYVAAVEKMHTDMQVGLTGDADVDFARAMIPHHQGGIDMAMVALKHGGNPQLRKLAEHIIAAHEEEIALLEAWLARNGQGLEQ